jgi:hypothetical protein
MLMTLLSPPLRVGRRFALPVLVALTLFLLALPPAPAPAAPDMEIAVQDDAVLVGRLYYDRDRALDQIRDMGGNRIRINMTWTEVLGSRQSKRRYQPHSIVYHWAKYDSAVNAALARGIRVHLTITGPAPRWATRNHLVCVYRPVSG